MSIIDRLRPDSEEGFKKQILGKNPFLNTFLDRKLYSDNPKLWLEQLYMFGGEIENKVDGNTQGSFQQLTVIPLHGMGASLGVVNLEKEDAAQKAGVAAGVLIGYEATEGALEFTSEITERMGKMGLIRMGTPSQRKRASEYVKGLIHAGIELRYTLGDQVPAEAEEIRHERKLSVVFFRDRNQSASNILFFRRPEDQE